jgi:hypothetical protein
MSEQQSAFPVDCPPVAVQPDAGLASATLSPGVDASIASRRPIEVLKWVFSFPAMLGMLLIGDCFYLGRKFLIDPDLWWHIKVGQEILRTHRWPTTDPYSFTAANSPWIAYEWLGEVIVGRVAQLGGNLALDALLIILASVVILALYYYGTLRSGNCKAGFLPAAIMCSVAFLSFSLRPQMFAYLFLVLLLIVLEWFRKGTTWPIWSLPLLFLAWVNTHGSFIVGIGILAVYLCAGLKSFRIGSFEAIAWTGEQRIKLELALLLSLAVLPITPYGTQLAAYPFDLMFNQAGITANIDEWLPLAFNSPQGKLFLGVVVLLIALQLMFRFAWRLEELVLAFGAGVLVCLHMRMLLLFVPLIVPIFATMNARWIPPYQRAKDKYLLNAAVMAVAVVAIIHYLPSRALLQKTVEKSYPVAAVRYLDAHDIPGNMFNNYGFGGYLLAAGRKTFIDGRGDIFERSGVLADYVYLVRINPGALVVLDHYQITHCLLSSGEPLEVVLLASPNWKRVYFDGTGAIFVRTSPASAVEGE